MRIIYCQRYHRYVAQHHCEFFNDGDSCAYHNFAHSWRSIKDLAQDEDRPVWDVTSIIKPFNCTMMDLLRLGAWSRSLAYGRRL
jgi:hypothetical protein